MAVIMLPDAGVAERDAEVSADAVEGMIDDRVNAALKRRGATQDGLSVDGLVGPLFFFGGPFVDSGSGDVPLSDTSNGHGGGTGDVSNAGTIVGVTVKAQVPPASAGLTIALYINGASIGSVYLDVGVSAYSALAAAAGLSVSGLNQGDTFLVDWSGTDGTVAGVHVKIVLRCDVQRGVG